jgi:hypothetical protein
MTDREARELFENLPMARRGPVTPKPPEGPRLLPGDRVPDFILPDPATRLHNFYDLPGGRPILLVLASNTARPDQWNEIKLLAEFAPLIDDAGVDLVIISNDGVESLAMVSKIIPAPAVWLADIRGVVNQALRAGAKYEFTGVVSFLLDANQRVIAQRGLEPGHASWAFSVMKSLQREAPLTLTNAAPILLLPRVLDLETCSKISALLPAEPGAVAPRAIADAELAAVVSVQLLRRVGPEVDKVFSFDDFVFESLALRREAGAAAEHPGSPQRDNRDPETTGRSFSVILDLDAEAYQGGGLRFPEYGPHIYRPGTGAAVVHAGGLQRELLPLEGGQRSLLTLTLRRPPRSAA